MHGNCCHVLAGVSILELLDKVIKKDMQDCWSFTCCLFWTLGSLLKCIQLESFLQVLFWKLFRWTGSTGSTFLFSRKAYSLGTTNKKLSKFLKRLCLLLSNPLLPLLNRQPSFFMIQCPYFILTLPHCPLLPHILYILPTLYLYTILLYCKIL